MANIQQNFWTLYLGLYLFLLFQNNIISESQSGFKPGDSCVNKLLTITHKINFSFDSKYEVSAAFLVISKAFEKVWHEGIIYKLKRNGVSGNFLKLITNFLKSRKERVVLSDKYSSWTCSTCNLYKALLILSLFLSTALVWVEIVFE